MVAAEVPVAFACNGEPFSVMMATPDDLEDFAFGFALAEGIVASADEVVIDSIETSLEGVAIALSIPSDRASVLEARRRSTEGRSGCGICGVARSAEHTSELQYIMRTSYAVFCS